MKASSWGTDLWVTLGDFMGKDANRPVARIDFGGCRTPKKWTFWTQKMDFFEPHPPYPTTKPNFWPTLWLKVALLADLGGTPPGYGPGCKIGNGNLYSTENRLSKNYNYMCLSHMCKRIWRSELWLSSYWQIIKSSRNCPKFHIIAKVIIFKVWLEFFRPTASFL